MEWSEFYYVYSDWAESTLRSRISSLEDIGSGDEVVDVVLDLPTEKLKAQLIRKAIRNNVIFSHDNFMDLEGELPDEVYRELGTYAGFDAAHPDVDPDNITWDILYSEYYDWDEDILLRRIEQLKNLGPADEVCETICNMVSWDCQDALYQKAVKNGVKFTREQREDMGMEDDDVEYVPIDDVVFHKQLVEFEKDVTILCENLDQIFSPKPKKKKRGFFRTLLYLLGAFAGGESKKEDSGHCDGDCANCPPHYGYRYGRWYYGHGHIHGCERGGNCGR